ncbi:MAG: hypothetical protein GY859_19055 [Desulfobacterales bacterium]|nr:hypothetical protein [Desulfobacterales bacterium]
MSHDPYRLRILTMLKHGRLVELVRVDGRGVDILLEQRENPDEVVAKNARKALLNLNNPDGVNRLCAIWEKEREERLEELIIRGGHMAAAPRHLKILTQVKQGRLEGPVEEDGDGVDILLDLRWDRDPVVADNARSALLNLNNPEGVDHLCAMWAKTRARLLEMLLQEGGHAASAPAPLRILTLLKQSRLKELSGEDAEGVDILLALRKDRDVVVAKNAKRALFGLREQKGVNHLCELWEKERDGELEELVVKGGCVATSPARLRVLTSLKQGELKGLAGANEKDVDVLIDTFLPDPWSHRDKVMVENGKKALSGLTKQESVNHLCATWEKNRDYKLKDIILKCGYIASAPLDLMVRTSFLQDRKPKGDLSLKILEDCLSDNEVKIAQGAAKYILMTGDDDLMKRLWSFVLENLNYLPFVRGLHLKGWRPADDSDRALFYLLADDLERYHEIDVGHALLRHWHVNGSPALKKAIAFRIRESGDDRLLDIFSTARDNAKKIATESEVDLLIETLAKKRDFEKMFSLLPLACYHQGARIVNIIRRAGWRAPAGQCAGLQERLEAIIPGNEESISPSPDAMTIYKEYRPILMGGKTPPLNEKGLLAWTEDEYDFKCRGAALVALAERNSPKLSRAANRASSDVYWEVRMAAAAAELLHPGTLSPENKELLENDNIYWVRSLLALPISGRLIDLTPAELEKIKLKKPAPGNRPYDPENFFGMTMEINPAAEYLLTLAEFLGVDVDVSREFPRTEEELDLEFEADDEGSGEGRLRFFLVR